MLSRHSHLPTLYVVENLGGTWGEDDADGTGDVKLRSHFLFDSSSAQRLASPPLHELLGIKNPAGANYHFSGLDSYRETGAYTYQDGVVFSGSSARPNDRGARIVFAECAGRSGERGSRLPSVIRPLLR